MENKMFGGKKILIRKAEKADIKRAGRFLDFINCLVEDNAKLLMNKKTTLKEETGWVKDMLCGVKNKTTVFLAAECEKKIVGTVSIELGRWRTNHVGTLSIAISNGYRGIGLGTYLMSEIMKLAKKELNPIPKVFFWKLLKIINLR